MLELLGVSKSFGRTTVLDTVTARFAPGTVTAIAGDNGAGKSTLLKAIAGIHPIDGGEIRLDGLSMGGMGVAMRRRKGIEMIYQDLALARQQSILANIFLGREACLPVFGFLRRRDMLRRAEERLAELGIEPGDLARPAGQLSGGQQQAVAIARATMFEPKVLLLDEPTAALAAGQADRVLEAIRREKAAGRIVILVSHRHGDVLAVADRTITMAHGRILPEAVS